LQISAESLATDSDAESYMGIHFPSSDIPKQARDLYLSNKSRYLCDRSAPTSRLLQANRSHHPKHPSTPRPLDMTYCHLRAMSPVHLIYLGHMGVESSMSIAVTVYGKLWGLICCHHMFALPVTFQARTACAYLGTLISTHLENMINTQRFDQCHQVRTLAEQYWNGYNVTKKDSVSAALSGTHKLNEVANAPMVDHEDSDTQGDVLPEDEYCSSCDERDYFDQSVAERLEGLDIDMGNETSKGQRKHFKSSSGSQPKKFRRRQDHDSRSIQDWSRMYERFVRAAGPTVCNLFGADYMLFMIQGRSIAIPSPALMPDPEAVSRFAQYLQTVRLKKTVVSNNISKDFHGMESSRGLSGAIYLPLSDDGSDFAIFCRQEQVVNVTWAVSPMRSPAFC
jgi:light-regulated signal transduction histidine kinase (bacteriophytochrome)